MKRHILCLVALTTLLACQGEATPPMDEGDLTATPTDASGDLPADASEDAPSDASDQGADLPTALACQADAQARGWKFCQGDAARCSLVFEDGTGCAQACQALGLVCESSFEDELGVCDYQRDEPALGCADTAHQSDYCVCAAPDTPPTRMDASPDMPPEVDMPSTRPPHEAILDELVGFGQGTTGGAGGPVLEVTTLADSGPGSLREAAARPGPAWIRFTVSGVIALEDNLDISSDKTIDGRGADITITNYGLYVHSGTNNVILTHLKLRDSDNDLIRFYNGGERMWVHHCDLSNGGDGAFDATEDVTGITVSHTHIFDHDKAMLIGSGSPEGDGTRMRWTGHHNWYEQVVQRLPFIRQGHAHSYNNLIMWRSGTAMAVRISPGQMFVENNVFMPQTNVGHKLVSVSDGAVLRLSGNLERPLDGDQIEYEEVSPSQVFDPSSTYTYDAEPADDALIAKIRAQAGWQDVPWPQ